MTAKELVFDLTTTNGDYGIIFNGQEPIAYAHYDVNDGSVAVSFKKGTKKNYTKTDILLAVFIKTGIIYGIRDYYVTENNGIFNGSLDRYNDNRKMSS